MKPLIRDMPYLSMVTILQRANFHPKYLIQCNNVRIITQFLKSEDTDSQIHREEKIFKAK